MDRIQGDTIICAVIGDPVAHSMSPTMHNAAFEALGLNYAYVAFHVTDVRRAVEGVRGFQIKGLSVTIPHKLEIMQYLDRIEPLAEQIGAVNTVTNKDGLLMGTNTDGYGAIMALESQGAINGQTIICLGVGGAARGIVFTLATQRKPEKIILAARKLEKAAALEADVQRHSNIPIETVSFEPDALRPAFEASGIAINCTPIGMHPNVDECLIPQEWMNEPQLIFDTIYNPETTLLLQRAQAQGAKTVNGVPMFVHQGAMQFHLWTGAKPPIGVMEEAVLNALRGNA